MGNKYFSNLKTHLEDSNSTAFLDGSSSKQEIFKFSSIILTTKENFSKRFAQFQKMEKTLYFLTFPDKTNFEDLDLSCLQWLGLENLEMELLEFKENYWWTCKFCDLRERLEKIECEGMMNENTTSNSENKILKVWNSLPISFKSMKSLGIALLTLFGSSYSCEQLFSTMNFIKSKRRNRLTDDMSSACITLKFTKYEPSINKLSATLQQQKSH